MIDATLQRKAKEELERRIQGERGRFYTPNGGIERFLDMIAREIPGNDGRIHIIILRAGNNLGKTALSANLASYLSGNYPNKWFDKINFLKSFRRPNRGRILTTANAAKTAYDEELGKWLPVKRYRASQNGHKFNQYYKIMDTGSEFDILTFDQDPMQGESVTLDWAIVDEPLPRRHFTALKSRFRFGGPIFFLLTALEGSGWYKHQFETDERLGIDVHVIELSSEENCIDHGIRGIIPHQALADQWADMDETELMARRDGKYLASSGLIIPAYRDENWTAPDGKIVGNVMNDLTGYHRDCFDGGHFVAANVIDPHDRKPWAIAWDVTFPNNDNVVIAEWPDDSLRLFHKIKSCSWDPAMYAKMIAATEKSILGRAADIRIIDPNFGNAPKATSKSTVIEELKKAGESLKWPLLYYGEVDDSTAQGIIALKAGIGDIARGQRPKQFVLAHCKNTRFALKNAAYKENRDEAKGISERPEIQYSDFLQLRTYRAVYGIRYFKPIDKTDPEVIAAEAARKARWKPHRNLATGFVGM